MLMRSNLVQELDPKITDSDLCRRSQLDSLHEDESLSTQTERDKKDTGRRGRHETKGVG